MSDASSPPPTASPRPTPPPSAQQHNTATSPSILTPLSTGTPSRQPIVQRQSSLAKDRMSTYSLASNASQKLSRPSSHMFASVRSSLPYSQVRDFAYPPNVSMHFGPPPISSSTPSGASTPAFESQARLGDLPSVGLDPANTSWANSAWNGSGAVEHLPQTAYSGGPDDHGPPYSEDEDLQSPIVVTSRRRWSAEEETPGSDSGMRTAPTGPAGLKDRAFFAGVNGDGSETYYVSGLDDMADGPGGELVTYDTGDPRHSSSMLSPDAYRQHPHHVGGAYDPENRYSRDYQFSIASPDEEMHGKAVALFDFVRENENELPLAEGQVIWVSYRHGQGWLVAEDPKTRESGLVPEAYVRLLRDIKGGMHYLSTTGPDGVAVGGPPEPDELSPDGVGGGVASGDSSEISPTEQRHKSVRSGSASNGDHHPPILSTFSTSSKDLDPYPHPLLASETGQAPPEIVGRGETSKSDTASAPTTTTPAANAKAGNANLSSPNRPANVTRKSSGRSTTSNKGSGGTRKSRSVSRSKQSSNRNSTVK